MANQTQEYTGNERLLILRQIIMPARPKDKEELETIFEIRKKFRFSDEEDDWVKNQRPKNLINPTDQRMEAYGEEMKKFNNSLDTHCTKKIMLERAEIKWLHEQIDIRFKENEILLANPETRVLGWPIFDVAFTVLQKLPKRPTT